MKEITGKIVRYVESVIEHVSTGSGMRTDAEVAKILNICKTCNLNGKPLFVNGYCKLCGCAINNSESPFVNKARMASSHCPLNPPRW